MSDDERPVDWRDLPPVDDDEREAVAIPRTPSQTFLAKHDVCHRSAFLYAKHKGGAGGHQLNRGSLFHEAVADLTTGLLTSKEQAVPPGEGKEKLREVLRAHPELTVPAYERDQLRGMIYNWCVGSYFWPERILGVEVDLELQVGDWLIRGRVDLIEAPVEGMLDITDYKTQWDMPKNDSGVWATGGHDGHGNPRFGGNFQTQVYALLAAFGHTPDGVKLGEAVERIRVFLRFPRYLREEGLAYREAEIDRRQLTDFRLDLEDQLASIEASTRTGKWQPTPGSHCAQCPSPYECPLPRHLRPESQAAEIESVEDLERLGASWYFQSTGATRLKSRIRAAADRMGFDMVYIGSDLALKFMPRESETIKDKAELRVGIEGAIKYGHHIIDGDFDWPSFVTSSQWTEFDKRKVSPRPERPADENDDNDNDEEA